MGTVHKLERLDRRGTAYRFEVERDVPWARLEEPGRFAGPHFLRRLGVREELVRLAETGGAPELDWAFALATAQAFVLLERDVARFVEGARILRPSRSTVLLLEEESKHSEMFQRFVDRLRAMRPEWLPDFDAAWRAPVSWTDLERRAPVRDEAELQWLIWLATLFFEEYTVWIHHALDVDDDLIQVAWRRAHACHAREEVHHVLTDAAYLDLLPVAEPQRDGLSRAFLLFIEAELDRLLCLDVVADFVARRLDRPVFGQDRRLRSLPLMDDLLEHRAFAQSRRFMPALRRLRGTASPKGVRGPPIRTLVDCLRGAAFRSEELGLVLVAQDGAEVRWTYGDLLARAERRLAGLQARNVRRGDVVLLLTPSAQDFLPTFWGCLIGGILPAPLAPPPTPGGELELERLLSVCASFGRVTLVLHEDLVEPMRGHAIARGLDLDLVTPRALDEAAGVPRPAEVHPDDVAFLQFSSGSTRSPKGIRLTHRNLVFDAEAMWAHRHGTARDTFVSWLPLFHDMGLIGFHLTPIVAAADQVLMPSELFARNPLSWLRQLDRHRGTITGSPSFALDRLLRWTSRRDLSGLDLSGLHCWLVGAEPISFDALSRTMDALAVCGLPRTALCPGYGLAEATLAVTMVPRGEEPRAWWVDRESLGSGALISEIEPDAPDAVALVDCGVPVDGVSVRVVDDSEEEVPCDVVGNVHVQGPSVSLSATDPSSDWLETGDLGVIHDGRLFITGRRKDVFFLGGRTLYAPDIDAVAAECPEVRPRGAALVIHPADADGVERRTLCVALRRTPDPVEALKAVVRHVTRRTGVSLDEIVSVSRTDLPRTTSGKLRRNHLAELLENGSFSDRPTWSPSRVAAAPSAQTARESTLELVRRIWSEALHVPAEEITAEADFHELGGTSVQAAEILGRLEEGLDRHLGLELLTHGKSVKEMAAYLDGLILPSQPAGPAPAPAREASTGRPLEDAVAVVALAVRLPGAPDTDAFWTLLHQGRSALGAVPAERFDAGALLAELEGVKKLGGAFLDDVERFDPEPFELADDVAAALDPQQRLILEVAMDALGQAIVPTRRVGVFVASGDNEYALRYLANPRLAGPHALLGALHNMVAGRIASSFGLTGPALTVDTACSSSLAAVHLAAHSIRTGDCDLALTGGVQVNLTDQVWRYFAGAGLLSPDSRCRPFDREARGLVPGEGAICMLLKPLSAALNDGDRVWGVLRGSAMNNDGGALSGTAPNPRGQREAIQRAWEDAGLPPSTAGYVEAHAAGTALGDALEAASLVEVFREARELLVGSVKSNLGHTFAVSGAAGLAKVLLALSHETLPPTLGCSVPAERIGFDRTNLSPCLEARPWPKGSSPRRAGVDSFGLGGTNVHVVVEEAPKSLRRECSGPILYPLAGPPGTLERVARSHIGAPGTAAARAAAAVRRARWGRERRAIVLDDGADLDAALLSFREGAKARRISRVALVLPGPGSQQPGMGVALRRREPVWREAWARCRSAFEQRRIDLDAVASSTSVDRIDAAQAAVFAFGYASWRWLHHLGLEPAAVLGHSAGEMLAAHIAGVLSFEDAVTLVAARGDAMAAAPAGGMAVIFSSEAEARSVITAHRLPVTVAALNAPSQTIISGAAEDLTRAVEVFSNAGHAARLLPVNTPAHSPFMAPVAEVLFSALEQIELREPERTWISTRSGRVMGRPTVDHWVKQLLEPVRFVDAVRTARAQDIDGFVELASTSGLTACVESTAGEDALCVALGRRDEDEHRISLESVAALWSAGLDLRLDRLGGGGVAPARIPAWPWAKRRLWIDAPAKPLELPAAKRARRLRIEEMASIADHRVAGRTTAPAALLIDELLARQESGAPGLKRMVVEAPLALEEGETRFLEVRPEVDAGGFRLVSMKEDESAEVTHLIGERAPNPPRIFDRVDLAAVEARCDRSVAPEAVYDLLRASGFDAGPRMRAIRGVHVGDGELVVRLETPDYGDRGRWIDPAILDGASQAVAACFVDGPPSPQPYLGFSIGAVSVWRPVNAAATAVVQIRSPLDAASSVLRYDILLANEEGELLAEVRDFTAKRVEPPAASYARFGFGPGRTPNALQPPAPEAAAEPSPASGTDDVELFLRRALSKMVRRPADAIALDDGLTQLGLDSMKAVRLVATVESHFGIALPATLLFEVRTLKEAIREIRRVMQAAGRS